MIPIFWTIWISKVCKDEIQIANSKNDNFSNIIIKKSITQGIGMRIYPMDKEWYTSLRYYCMKAISNKDNLKEEEKLISWKWSVSMKVILPKDKQMEMEGLWIMLMITLSQVDGSILVHKMVSLNSITTLPLFSSKIIRRTVLK